MFEFLFGKKKKAAPVAVAAAVSDDASQTSTAVLEQEPELPELEKVRKNYSKPQLPRDESVIQGEIDELLRQRQEKVNQNEAAVAVIRAEIDETKRLADKAMVGLLEIEADLKQSIIAKRDKDIDGLKNKITSLSTACTLACGELDEKAKVLQIEMAVRPIDAKFPRIDMSFLKQNRPVPNKTLQLPKFAMFSIDNSKCSIAVTAQYYYDTYFQTSPAVYEKFIDSDGLKNYAKGQVQAGYRSCNVKALATFKGAIPPVVRELLVDAKKTFECVYLVNEPEWQLDTVLVPFAPPRDPLVIGYKHGIYWLLASFDTTPAEEYIRREFTQGELKDVRG